MQAIWVDRIIPLVITTSNIYLSRNNDRTDAYRYQYYTVNDVHDKITYLFLSLIKFQINEIKDCCNRNQFSLQISFYLDSIQNSLNVDFGNAGGCFYIKDFGDEFNLKDLINNVKVLDGILLKIITNIRIQE